MKSLKAQLMAAIAMTLVSAITIGSSTFAWFSMNTTVSATGMEVKASSEGGIVIGAYTVGTDALVAPEAGAYANTASGTVALPSGKGLYPTSTPLTLANWYHATSASVNSSTAKTGSYETLTIAKYASGGKEGKGCDSTATNYYYLMNKFAVKSLDTEASGTNLYIKSVSIATDPATAKSTALNNSLRIAVKCDDKVIFFAPMYSTSSGVTFSYYNGTSVASNSGMIIGNGTDLAQDDKTKIGTVGTTPIAIEVYMYYEGEDPNCKSINAVNIDTLKLDIQFAIPASA